MTEKVIPELSAKEAAAAKKANIDRIMKEVMLKGDLNKIDPQDRMEYYLATCESLGLNTKTQPFAFIQLNNKLQMYAKKDATDQLREIHKVSISQPVIEHHDDMVIVAVNASVPSGRTDSDIGAVSLAGLRGEAKANGIMKAITKAKRRVTLSICGLGMLDESEVAGIGQMVNVDMATGEIVPPKGGFGAPVSPGSSGGPDPLEDSNEDEMKAKRAAGLNERRAPLIVKILEVLEAEPFETPEDEKMWMAKYAGITLDHDWQECDYPTIYLLATCLNRRQKGKELEPHKDWIDEQVDAPEVEVYEQDEEPEDLELGL